MSFHPFDVTAAHVVYTCLGAFVVLFGMFSLFLRERLYIGEACWAFIFGVIIGPFGANVFNPRSWGGASERITNTITLEFTRVVLAIGVFAIGVELPKAYMARHWKSLFFLLVPVMTWGWFVSAGLIYALIPGLNFLSSLAVAACLTPTDPILAAAVVGGKWADKHVPAHLRHLLAAESGCNDGAAFPFLFISLYLLLDAPDTGAAIRDWFLLLWLYQVILGIIIGGLIGFGFRHLMKFCQRYDLIDRHSYVAQYVSLAILTIGVTTLLGSDDLLAAFACGTTFAWDGFFNRQTEESVFSSVIDLLFNVGAFVFVGAWMPFSAFQNAELTLSVWRLIVIAILILILRRLPVIIALYRWIPDIKTVREAIFSGHFGPIGIGAIFISTLAIETIEKNQHGENHQIEVLSASIQPIVAFMVLCSITIHGLSIPSFSLGRRVHSVSRTWSRHAAPDWTNQARLVDRGADDIVINRDSEMERGQISLDDKATSEQGNTAASQAGVSTPDKQPGDEGSLETKLEEPADVTEAKDDTPPDGTELVTEWQEPHHRVIERRSSPGEDVDVEVTNEETPGVSLSTQIRRSLKNLDGLRRTARDLERDTGKAIEGEVKEIETQVKEIEHNVTEALALQPSGGAPAPNVDEEEEGWASDRSYNGRSSISSVDAKRKPRLSKVKPTGTKSSGLGSGRRGRQRISIRRGNVPLAIRLGEASQASSPRDSDEEERGRTAAPTSTARDPASTSKSPDRSRPSTTERQSRPGTGESSLRNQRLEHIRALYSSPPTREVSPSRSVRFMDEVPVDAPRPPEGDEPESAKSKVTFEVPKSPGGIGNGKS